jgi:hypothetical protein
MVTERYHLVEWRTWDNDGKIAGDLVARELYDNRDDPQENVNLADISKYAGLVEELSAKLSAGWRGARPR